MSDLLTLLLIMLPAVIYAFVLVWPETPKKPNPKPKAKTAEDAAWEVVTLLRESRAAYLEGERVMMEAWERRFDPEQTAFEDDLTALKQRQAIWQKTGTYPIASIPGAVQWKLEQYAKASPTITREQFLQQARYYSDGMRMADPVDPMGQLYAPVNPPNASEYMDVNAALPAAYTIRHGPRGLRGYGSEQSERERCLRRKEIVPGFQC